VAVVGGDTLNIRRRELVVVAGLAVAFGAAPTVGDVGACGRMAVELDSKTFATARKNLDCERCQECGLSSQTCQNACDPNAPSNVGWPGTCHPLQHDGDVCLRALHAAGCNDYAAYVDDTAPTVPTECDFCHLVGEGGVARAGP
jgi:hypothetical protein